MNRRVRLFLRVGITLASLFVLWFLLLHWFMPAKPVSHPNSGTPLVAYMDDAYAIQYDEKGKRKEEIFMGHWHHQLNSQQSHFEKLQLIVHKPTGDRWDIRALEGIGYHSDLATALEFIQLNNNVHIDAIPPGLTAPLWQMDTDELFVYPKFAQTQAPVRVYGPNGAKLQANGLNAQWDKDYVEFLENVHATYELSAHSSGAH